MPSTRRDFLSHVSLAALSGTALGSPANSLARASSVGLSQEPSGKPGKLLMLGGTRFLGPQVVERALQAGWEVTLFNRGRSNPELFADLDKRKGDRNTSDYESLKTGEWDVVIDTSGYIPQHVTDVAELLKGRVGHYVFVSTLSVYDPESENPGVQDESSRVGAVPEDKQGEFATIQDVGKFGSAYYGALKAGCEAAAEAVFPGATANVRPGLIVGPEDPTDRFTYWPVRVNRVKREREEILAPGDPNVGLQFIDVRDLGEWCFECAERRVAGVYNAVGFDGVVTFQEFLHACKLVSGANAEFTWMDDEFLREQEVGPWMELPLWIPGGGKIYSNAKGVAEGLRFRPVAETIRATLDWHEEKRGDSYVWRGAGLAAEKEAKVLKAWHEKG